MLTTNEMPKNIFPQKKYLIQWSSNRRRQYKMTNRNGGYMPSWVSLVPDGEHLGSNYQQHIL